jgi:hypothetical protein
MASLQWDDLPTAPLVSWIELVANAQKSSNVETAATENSTQRDPEIAISRCFMMFP